VVIDADRLAREVLAPGTTGFDSVVARFGGDVVKDGQLNRPALAAIVFSDQHAREALNAIVHPLVRQRSAALMAQAAPDAIVVYDVPLLVESDMAGGFDRVVVVEAPVEARLERLEQRGLTRADARARMASQASDDARRAVADEIVPNDGTREDLAGRVDVLWRRLLQCG